MDEYLRTSEDIIRWTESAKAKKAEMLNSGDWRSVYICFGFDGRTPKQVVPHTSSDTPVIAKNKHGYVCNVSPDKTKWTCVTDITKAIVFANTDDAYLSLPNEPFTLLPAERKENAVNKTWVLAVNRFGRKVFIDKLSSRSCSMVNLASNARKRFASAEDALKWYEDKIGPRFPGLTDPVPQKIAEV